MHNEFSVYKICSNKIVSKSYGNMHKCFKVYIGFVYELEMFESSLSFNSLISHQI